MKKPITIGAKVKITGTSEQLHAFGMFNDKINDDLKKYNADVTDVLKKASFPVNEDGSERCKVFIINGVFTIPECYLKDITDDSEDEKQEDVLPSKIETLVEKETEKEEENLSDDIKDDDENDVLD